MEAHMAVRGVTLVREVLKLVPNALRGDVFRLRIKAIDPVMMPKHIFGHQQHNSDAFTGAILAEFCFVASPFDASIYPADTPDPTQNPPYYRKDTIDVLVPSTEIADEVWNNIKTEVTNLVASYNRLDVLKEVESVRIGGDDDSLSSSESDS